MVKEAGQDGAEDGAHGGFAGRGQAQHGEVAQEAGGYLLPASTGGPARRTQRGVLNLLPEQLLAVVEAAADRARQGCGAGGRVIGSGSKQNSSSSSSSEDDNNNNKKKNKNKNKKKKEKKKKTR